MHYRIWLGAIFLLLNISNGVGALPAPNHQLTLTSARTHYFVGENVLVNFSVHNRGAQNLTIEVGGDYRGSPRSLRFKVEAFDSHGKPLEDPHPNPMCFGGLGWSPVLKPGETFTTTLALAHYRRVPGRGHCRIVASHDLGLKETATASLDLDFQEPTASEARSIVANMTALPAAASVTSGKPSAPFRDFWTLSYPVYLTPLVDATSSGNQEALLGIGQIANVEATEQLLRLAGRPGLRRAVVQQIGLRLPPESEAPDAFGAAERRRLSRAAWSPATRAATRKLAHRLLSEGSDEELSCGAVMLARLGGIDDLPDVLLHLDRRLPAVSTYPRPGGPADDLERAVVALTRTGPAPQPTNSGTRLILLRRPHPSPALIEAGLKDRSARVRELAILAVHDAAPYRKQLLVLLDDPDPGAQVAACEKLAGADAVLQKARQTQDEWILRAAVNASVSRRLECAKILTDRLGERQHWLVIYQELVGLVLTWPPGNSSNGDPSPTELSGLQSAWRAFLSEHGPALGAGKTFATLPANLVPSNFQFSP